MLGEEHTGPDEPYTEAFTSIAEVTTVRFRRNLGLIRQRPSGVPGLPGSKEHDDRWVFPMPESSARTFPPPLAPRPLWRVNAWHYSCHELLEPQMPMAP
jgi:hypothetical protein